MNTLRKRTVRIFFALAVCMAMAFGFAACSNGESDNTAFLASLLAGKDQPQSSGGGQDSNPTTTPAPTTSDPTATTTTTPTPTPTPTPTETVPTPAATYTITFNANDGSETPATAAQTFTAETPQALKTIAELGFSKTGFYFAGWGEAADAEKATYSDGTQYVAAQDATLYALWSAMPVFSVKVLDSAGGVVTATPATGFAGVEIELTAQPKSGYQFGLYVVVDAANNPIPVTDGKFTMPQSEVFVAGVFSAINYNIVLGAAANGSVTASAQTATVGTKVTLTATPDNGYKLAGLVVKDSNGASVPTREEEGAIKFTMPAQSVTVTATFSVNGHTVTFNANDGSQSPATATQDFAHGVAAALKSVEELGFAKPGFYFAGWGLKADARSASYADGAGYICVEDKILYALWTALPVYNVNTPVNSFGIVTATPATGYPGAEIAVKAEPKAGYALDSCAVADAAGKPIPLVDGKFTMPEGQVTVTANFTAINYKINVGSPENGTVAANAANATVGTEVALDVTPNPGYFLESLTVMADGGSPVNISGADNARTFRMPAQNVTVTAVFSLIPHKIDVGAAENGSVSASVATAVAGTEVTLSNTPNAGYKLVSYSVRDADGAAVTVTDGKFTMPAQSVTVSATFSAISYTVTCGTIANGSVTATPATATVGTKVTLSNTRNAGYKFVSYIVRGEDGAAVSVADGKFTMPAQNVTVSATFSAISYTVTCRTIVNGSVTATPATATIGTEITLSNTPKEGYQFASYTVKGADGESVSVADGKFTMPAQNVTVSATFCAISYSITIEDSANGRVIANSATATVGTKITLSNMPKAGYQFASYNVKDADGTAVTVSGGKFTMPAKNVTVTATFKAISYMTFGSWPQTIKAANVNVSEQCESKTTGEFTYYKGSDGQWYAKIKENAIESGYKYSDGTFVAEDSANSYKWFKVEPIKWRVLTTDYDRTGKKLLHAENILIVKRYDAHKTGYETSEIRKWLNSNANSSIWSDHEDSGGFFKTAFTAAEIAKIADTRVNVNMYSIFPDNYSSLDYREKEEWYGGEHIDYSDAATTDKVFLLSVREATKNDYGFDVYNAYKGDGTHDDSTRIRQATDYAKASGAMLGSTEGMGGVWWLRSYCYLSGHDPTVHVVRPMGKTTTKFGHFVDTERGVVPALCVSD